MRRSAIARNEEGQASVIGTLLAISILLSIVSIIVTGFVPRWGEDREVTHMKEVYAEFSRLKANIDQQILDTKNSNGPSVVMYSPITLGMQTVPIFTSSSGGTLAVNQVLATWTVSNTTQPTMVSSTGTVMFDAANLYSDDVTYVYECGGLLVVQDTFATVKVGPQFNAWIRAGEFYVDYTLISLLSDSDSKGGSDTVGIVTQCTAFGNDSYEYPAGEDVSLTLVTEYPNAWDAYFSIQLAKMGLEKGAGGDFTVAQPGTDTLVVGFSDVHHLRLGFAAIKTRLE